MKGKDLLSVSDLSSEDIRLLISDAIDIKVDEQKPLVRWGEKSFLNAKGERFTPN